MGAVASGGCGLKFLGTLEIISRSFFAQNLGKAQGVKQSKGEQV